MTRADIPEFSRLCKRIVHSLDCKMPSKERLDILFEKMRFCHVKDFERAVEHWIDTGKRFPSVADLKEAARLTRRLPERAQQAVVDANTPYCYMCGDDGWVEFWCVGQENHPQFDPLAGSARVTEHCGRHFEHGGHEFVKRCACYHTNPVLKLTRSV